jgi:predicted dehydrogenase
MQSRRQFLSKTAMTAGAVFTAKSYSQIAGSNARLNFAVIGLNGRAGAHLSSLHANKKTARLTHVVDVDSVIMDRFAGKAESRLGEAPTKVKDFRKMLEIKDVDVITIATPDHLHTPIAIYGLKAGKHVYVEKPCSHNPHEVELLTAAVKKHGKKVQMGNQQRSSDHTKEIVGQIHNGLIGRAYLGQTWYRNMRKSMGVGKEIAVPATLDWDLWQGPAPRRHYKDNVHPYNWHWLKVYGTGETLNNGTHEVDVARWALGVDYPERVSAEGGRYHFKDDWEFYDTLNVSFGYGDKMLTWDCLCCNNMPLYGRDRGTCIHGTEGSVIVDRDGYEVWDLKGKMTKQYSARKERTSSSDTVGADTMTDQHFANLIDAITSDAKLDSPISDAGISVKSLLMANIAYDLKRPLKVDTSTGTFVNDAEATRLSRRTYEKGWEPTI